MEKTACAKTLSEPVSGALSSSVISIPASLSVIFATGTVTFSPSAALSEIPAEPDHRSDSPSCQRASESVQQGFQTTSYGRFSTGPDGQITLKSAHATEIRLKENTVLSVSASDAFDLERGLAGFHGSSSIIITAPHIRIAFFDGLLVVKAHPLLTRAAVLKGDAVLSNSIGDKRTLASHQEGAAGPRELSSVYVATDELYFAWYWDAPKR
ncbi:MAG: hypothetical protein HQM09_04655 [Candidatus Riflebacteria bacterium]|nr:hypothetical protein [Candidatus Riflebacteria bacterium]